MNDNGEVAFCAGDLSPWGGAYIATRDALAPVAIVDRTSPEGFSFIGPNIAVNNHRDVVFYALAQQSSGQSIAGLYTGPDPETDFVIRTGDRLFGSIVLHVQVAAGALNDSGTIVFYYYCEDRASGIAVAIPKH
jgi:hypothetical protein